MVTEAQLMAGARVLALR